MEFLFGRYRATIPSVIATVFAAASLLPSIVMAADGSPGPHTLDGSYTRLDIQWQQLWARVETAHAGDDQRISSDRFHSWGALLGIMAFVEAGEMPAPEEPLVDHVEEVASR